MTQERSGDPARTLELLWRGEGEPRSQRGPRPGLTVGKVVETAIAVADAEGVQAVTIRRVAQELGVAAMSLYTYVPGKAELLDLMLDTIYGRMRRSELSDQPWRERVTAIAEENRDLYAQHPWAASASPSRPPLGPGLMAKYEHELRAFEGLGLDDVEMDAALTHLLNFVQAYARSAAEADRIRRDTAMSDEQWWAAHAPFLERALDPVRYPTAVRVGAAAGAAQQGAYSPAHVYEFGLRRVLDGFGVLIESRAGGASGQTAD